MAQNVRELLTQVGTKGLPLLAGVGGVAWLGASAVYTVEAGHSAIKYNRWTGVQQATYREGVHFLVPWLERPIIYEVRAKAHQMSSLTGSKDLQMVNVSLRCLYRPDGAKLSDMYRYLGKDYDERVLQSIINEVLKSVVAQYNASALITQREKVSQVIRQRLTARAKDFYILLDDVALTHINFSPEYEKAVEAKQVSQQQAVRAQFLVLKALEEKKKTIIHAEGESKSAQMIGESIKENPGFLELRRVEVAKEVAGVLAKSSNRMVLSTESLLLNLMGGSQASDNMEKNNAAAHARKK